MSMNRGMKRDSYGANRNFNNRNMGGGGGRMGNNVGNGMSPWETGVMPGRGILPTPNSNLNLASPQAQLAIASNLISNLLRQQDSQPQKVPSLLSLGNNYNSQGNFTNQQNYNQGRYNDRSGGRVSVKSRLAPYNNKMGNNNRARDPPSGRRGQQRQSGNQRNEKSSKSNSSSASKQNQNNKKEQQDKNSDNKNDEKAETPVALSKISEDNDENEEGRKREWKEEKKEKLDGDVEKTDEKIDDVDQEKKTAARHAESRYSEIPIDMMTCHVCKKHMWDGSSFENHLRGRAHLLMMDKLDESYKLKVELMRHELRVAEEQRELTLNNSKRRGKKLSVDLSVREYCTMCDLNFFGTISSHRKSEKHQELKTFLHPRCSPCGKEFPSRIEFDEHCLTPIHMKNQCEEQKKVKREKLGKGESEVRTEEDEDKDNGDFKNDIAEDNATFDIEKCITDLPEGNLDTKLKIPSFRQVRQHNILLGQSMIKEITGYHCEKCHRFMLTEEDMNAHLKSMTHYRYFSNEIKSLIGAAEKEKKKEEKLKEEKDEAKEPESKRVKLDNEADKNNDLNDKKEKVKDGNQDYDPSNVSDSDEDQEKDEEDKNGENDSNEPVVTVNDDDVTLDDPNDEEEQVTKKTQQNANRGTQQTRASFAQKGRGNRARRSRR